jgi:hypothetical protein
MFTSAAIMLAATVAAPASAIVIDESHATPRDERQTHAAWLGFRPADGQAVDVNPPRFSWPYEPGIVAPDGYDREHTFILQIAKSATFAPEDIILRVETPLNFYNAIPPLRGGRYLFWRVGYDVGSGAEQWSRVRCFIVEPWTPQWDRSIINDIGEHLQGHPRIGFTPENVEALREMDDGGPHWETIRHVVLRRARRAMQQDWFADMPATDSPEGDLIVTDFRDMASDMMAVAMAYMLTGDEQYLAVREPLTTLASYPPGGVSSPEGMVHRKWGTMITMHMGLAYDWLHPQLTAHQRAQIADCLDWRVEHILKDFSWKRRGKVFHRGLAGMVGSHQYQNALWTLVGALAIYDESEAARECTDVVLNYITGVANGFGETEAWNEGTNYGNGKFGSLLDAAIWADMTVPELSIGSDPYYPRVGRFFSYLTPVGIERTAWGNYGRTSATYLARHQTNFLRMAYLTGEGPFVQNWLACNEVVGQPRPHLQEWLLPHFYDRPEPQLEEANEALFNTAGWAMAFSGPPSDTATYRDGVGMTFHCRPRGGYSHSFNNENAFEAFAYGSVIATGGGRKSNGDRHADATMSHNAVLIGGRGQDFEQLDPETETAGRIIAWHAEPGLVYWCGDATEAYRPNVPDVKRALRHVLFVDDSYFVIFDDLALADGAAPARFSWLYHIHQDVPVEIDDSAATFEYAVGEANVQVRHLMGAGGLGMQNLRGEDGYRNPITGEDMLQAARGSVESSPLRTFSGEPVWNNLWVTSTPRRTWQFLATVTPWRDGMQQPTVEPLGERHFAVETEEGRRTIFFGPQGEVDADIVVDYERISVLSGPPILPPGWVLWEADLSDLQRWVIDGEGSIDTLTGGVMKIDNEVRSTCWAPVSVQEPVLFDFEARTDDEMTRAIFFFMAEGPEGEDIFDWERPNADYGDYAYTGKMELYTAGMLRQGCGTEANFRRIGQLPEELAIMRTPRAQITDEQLDDYRQAYRRFQPATIHDSAMDGYERGTWARYQVLVDGGLVRVRIDGRPLMQVSYEDPLTSGRFGFRNFRKGTSILVRDLRVMRPGEPR